MPPHSRRQTQTLVELGMLYFRAQVLHGPAPAGDKRCGQLWSSIIPVQQHHRGQCRAHLAQQWCAPDHPAVLDALVHAAM